MQIEEKRLWFPNAIKRVVDNRLAERTDPFELLRITPFPEEIILIRRIREFDLHSRSELHDACFAPFRFLKGSFQMLSILFR